ncbi:carboxypeptidase-like regulatory domain-containing protein [Maribacter cobaltidurans]|nr:carboxypeptidase-like regulatory domain-containing protein [Maribacter cobaltidurans]
MIKGSNKGTMSNIHGYFTIENLRPGNYTLRLSSLGFSKKKCPYS